MDSSSTTPSIPTTTIRSTPTGKIYGMYETYGKRSAATPEETVENLIEQNIGSLYMEPIITLSDTTWADFGVTLSERMAILKRVAELCEKAGIELVVGLYTDPLVPDVDCLKAILRYSRRLVLGKSRTCEYDGNAKQAKAFKTFARKMKFEWICPITQTTVVKDIARGGPLRDELLSGGIECFCLCGYVLFGYLEGDIRIPHQAHGTGLAGKNIHARWGLTREKLIEYNRPLNILTGAGFQRGIDSGSRQYAEMYGFKGLIVGTPIDLSKSLTAQIHETPLEVYPTKCGDPNSGYRDLPDLTAPDPLRYGIFPNEISPDPVNAVDLLASASEAHGPFPTHPTMAELDDDRREIERKIALTKTTTAPGPDVTTDDTLEIVEE